MHEYAEFGHAAHWLYKESDAPEAAPSPSSTSPQAPSNANAPPVQSDSDQQQQQQLPGSSSSLLSSFTSSVSSKVSSFLSSHSDAQTSSSGGVTSATAAADSAAAAGSGGEKRRTTGKFQPFSAADFEIPPAESMAGSSTTGMTGDNRRGGTMTNRSTEVPRSSSRGGTQSNKSNSASLGVPRNTSRGGTLSNKSLQGRVPGSNRTTSSSKSTDAAAAASVLAGREGRMLDTDSTAQVSPLEMLASLPPSPPTAPAAAPLAAPTATVTTAAAAPVIPSQLPQTDLTSSSKPDQAAMETLRSGVGSEAHARPEPDTGLAGAVAQEVREDSVDDARRSKGEGEVLYSGASGASQGAIVVGQGGQEGSVVDAGVVPVAAVPRDYVGPDAGESDVGGVDLVEGDLEDEQGEGGELQGETVPRLARMQLPNGKVILEGHPALRVEEGRLLTSVVVSSESSGNTLLVASGFSIPARDSLVAARSVPQGKRWAANVRLFARVKDTWWNSPGHGDWSTVLEKYSLCSDGIYHKVDQFGRAQSTFIQLLELSEEETVDYERIVAVALIEGLAAAGIGRVGEGESGEEERWGERRGVRRRGRLEGEGCGSGVLGGYGGGRGGLRGGSWQRGSAKGRGEEKDLARGRIVMGIPRFGGL
ncbi:hypothetical protein CLOM_g9986 [Closterium sp. NIES-68]|nr:hypothetical protein CLOM_g9986 [Closterium sp. NIES-68]